MVATFDEAKCEEPKLSESKSAIFIKNTASPGFEETDLLRCQLASAHLGGDPLAVVTIALDLVERLGDEGRVAEATAVLREVAPVALSCGAERQPWVPASLLLLHSLTCDVGPSNEAALASQIANCWHVFQTNVPLIDDRYLGFCLGAADKLLVAQDDFQIEELQKIELTVLQGTERVPLRYHEITFSVLARLSLRLELSTELEKGICDAVFSAAIALINRMVLAKHQFSNDAIKHICSLCETDIDKGVKQISSAFNNMRNAHLLDRVSVDTQRDFCCTHAEFLLKSGQVARCKKLIEKAVPDLGESFSSITINRRWIHLCLGVLVTLSEGTSKRRNQVASAYPELTKWVECFAGDSEDQVDLLGWKAQLANAARDWPQAIQLHQSRNQIARSQGYSRAYCLTLLFDTIQALYRAPGDDEISNLLFENFKAGSNLARDLLRSGSSDDHDLWWWVIRWVMERRTYDLDDSTISEFQEIYVEAENAITDCLPEQVKYLANLMENIDATIRPHLGVETQGTRLH